MYTSPPSPYKSGRDALGWFEQVMSPIPVAQSCSLPSGSLRVRANASRAVLDAWDYVLIFAASALALLVVVNVLVFWLVSQALKPFARIVQGLNQLQAGRFDIALPTLA